MNSLDLKSLFLITQPENWDLRQVLIMDQGHIHGTDIQLWLDVEYVSCIGLPVCTCTVLLYCLVLGLKVNQPTMQLLYRCTQGRGCVKCTMKYFIEKIIAHFKTGDIEWEFLSLLHQNQKSDFEECLRMTTSHPVLSKEKHLLAYWQVCYFSFCFHRWVKYHKEQKRMASYKWK